MIIVHTEVPPQSMGGVGSAFVRCLLEEIRRQGLKVALSSARSRRGTPSSTSSCRNPLRITPHAAIERFPADPR
jgi:hypothetical protein